MKTLLNKCRHTIEPHGWWLGILSAILSIIDAVTQWRITAMFEFGALQWTAFFIILGLLLLKEWQTRDLTKAFDTAFKIALDHQAEGTRRLIEQISSGELIITPQTQREIQRYLDTLSRAVGRPEQADELLDKLEEIKKGSG